MIRNYLNHRIQSFSKWWRAPVSLKDRVKGSVVGGFGFFIIAFCALFLYNFESFGFLFKYALLSGISGIILGAFLPKIIFCICYPVCAFIISIDIG
jgi:hypothetical protein